MAATETKKKSILVVEDEPALQEAVKLKLTQKGIDVVTANSGEEAVQKLKEKKPSLVWLDVLLPGMNGLEVLRWIRESSDFKDLPAVIVSVSGGQEKIKQAFSMNVLDYIVKSEYTIDDIVKRVQSFL